MPVSCESSGMPTEDHPSHSKPYINLTWKPLSLTSKPEGLVSLVGTSTKAVCYRMEQESTEHHAA